MKSQKRPSRLRTILGTVFVLAVAVLVVPFTGAIDVGATSPHLPGLEWFLETTRERSIAKHSENVRVPDDLDSPERIARGLVAYEAMCADCHGAPGREPTWMHRGLDPEPPELWDAAEKREAAEDYWIIRHGIRMTGMPALEPTHEDEEIWDLTAALGRLGDLTARSYASALDDAQASVGSGHGHSGHDHGSGEESASREGISSEPGAPTDGPRALDESGPTEDVGGSSSGGHAHPGDGHGDHDHSG